jgi:protein-disulfide isomerase
MKNNKQGDENMHEEHETESPDKITEENESVANESADEQGVVTISKLTLWKIIAGILALLLVIFIFTGGFGGKPDSTGIAPTAPAAPGAAPQAAQAGNGAPSPAAQLPTAQAKNMAVLAEDDAFEGNANATVTIVEWSDYQCPFCEKFYSQTLGQIREQYVDTGKVKFVYRDFPLDFHENAQKAAEAAECAGEQGKYWEMHNKLFEEGVSGGVAAFKQYAEDIGLDAAKFNECLDSGAMASEIKKDLQDGQVNGISGTPGFIINGQLVTGAQPFSAFQQVIEAALAK